MNGFSDFGLLRLRQIIGDKKANPPIPPIIPVSKATWYAGVRAGRYPRPVQLGANMVAWRWKDIRQLVEQGAMA